MRGNVSAMRGKAPYGAGTCLQYAGRGHHPAGELFIWEYMRVRSCLEDCLGRFVITRLIFISLIYHLNV